MKILWITNVAVELNNMSISRGGWMKGALSRLVGNDNIEVAVAYPGKKYHKKLERELTYYSFREYTTIAKYCDETRQDLGSIMADFCPDVIHIWGTEYSHSLAAVIAAEERELLTRTVINIQGLVSQYAKVYFAGIPYRYRLGLSLKELYKGESIRKSQKAFEKRGVFECEALKKVPFVIGRTDWDKACTSQLNPKGHYFFCNEILRDSFYCERVWNVGMIEKYSLFVSQAGYPIKGLHQVFSAMAVLKEKYPQLQLYVAGPDKFCQKESKKRIYNKLPRSIKRDSYERFLYRTAKKYGVLENVTFLGELNEQEMRERYLKTHVFISPSVIENESNSISEAKILGVPCVAAYVGGVTNRIEHGQDGYFYPWNEPYMLSYYVDKIFANSEVANEFSKNAKKRMTEICDPKSNAENLIRIYYEIMEGIQG